MRQHGQGCVAGDMGGHDLAHGLVRFKQGFGELRRAPHTGCFHQHRMVRARLCGQMARHLGLTGGAQRSGAGFDRGAVHGWHFRSRGAFARRIRKYVQPSQIAIAHQIKRALEHLIGFGRETGDDIGAKHHIRAQFASLFTKRNGIIAQVAAFHAFENHIMAMLQ